MATQRVQHLFSINRTWWLLDATRHDVRVPARVINKYLRRKQASINAGIAEATIRPLTLVNIPRVDEWYDHVLFNRKNKSGKLPFPLALKSAVVLSPSSTQMFDSRYTNPNGSFDGKAERRSKSSDLHLVKIESTSQNSSLNTNHRATASHDAHQVQANPGRVEKQQEPTPSGGIPDGRPSPDQVLKIYNILQETLPKLFTQPMNYTIYRNDLLFINNLTNRTTVGLMKYVQQVSLLRIIGHLKYAYVRLELVSMSQDLDEGRITVRWRIAGISGLRVMLKFWKFRLWKYQEIMNQQEVWHDGISYFDVGADGLVYRHIADKVEEDKDRLVATKGIKNPLLAKLAIFASLFPKTGLPIQEAVACQSKSSGNDGCAEEEASRMNKDGFSLQ